ncbi:RNA-directed DNA polymerase, eukaryota [Tanacetum coccineum]|uniref:RNA-directed DNA polymerase, eukaryota n=1 Tax=Tanacetum coccineum TaxID=301880 RepID=A0ABQ5GYB7_9ASTR
MVFKVDFEKEFDSVRWDYLDDMLNKFGFRVKWRGWIQGCLNTAIGSILVNRSPTFKFEFHKGLKQRDLLSPFLSILIMESLHFSFKYVVNASLYKGIPIDDTLILNHLFYADDVMFVGKRDTSKVNTIVNVLKCFFLASGLKIILHKSKLMGIGISHSEVVLAAESLESIRPNFFNGVANSDKRLAMIGWKKVFASKKMEGLAFQVSLLLTVHFFLNGYGASSPKAPLYGLGLLMPFMDPKALLIINISFLDALLSSISSESLKVSLLKIWNLESSGDFSVKSARVFIDDSLLPKLDTSTRWVNVVPIKINIFAWRVCLDKLPTRLNLSVRGVDIPSILCPLCSITVESSLHLFFSCHLARQLMLKVARW